MAQFWTPSGLSAIAQTESSGNPTAVNPTSGASGLYGFLNSTWQSIAPQAGVDTSQYPTAASAPASVQTSVAAITPVSNWTCTGCNSLASSIAATAGNTSSSPTTTDFSNFTAPLTTPDFFSVSTTPGSQTNVPITDGGATNSSGDSFTFNSPTEATQTGISQNSNTLVDPFTGTFINPTTGAQDTGAIGDILSGAGALGTGGLSIPGTTAAGGASPDQATAGTDFFTNAFNDIWNLAQRGGLIILGIVLIAVAAFWLASGQGRAVLQRIRP